MNDNSSGGALKKADPNTIQNKFLVGYQGWFTCRGDGPPVHTGHHGWLHWFNRPIPDGGRPNIDLWPDVSAYSPSELFPAPGLTLPGGLPACLFSSRHPRTVQRHFHWMAKHGVDGCFLQRFASQIEADGNTQGPKADLMRLRDEIGDRVKEAAENEGRVFAIMYDVSGVPADQLQKILEVDWNHLIRQRALLDSPNYLRERGRPVVAIWGVGFAKNHHDPVVIRQIVRNIRSMTPGGAYIMAGTPTHWQTLNGDADHNPAFRDLFYNEFDAISPWTVGRYRDQPGADRFAAHKIHSDMQAIQQNCKRRRVDYIPVVWPGGSEHHLSNKYSTPNFAPRDGGKFLWRQIFNAKSQGARIIYGAMWDEYDEGTALMPVVPYKYNLPQEERFLALDADGYDLPPDWYMRICGLAGEGLRGERAIEETFPKKELDDYWSSRPKYTSKSTGAFESVSATGSGTFASASGSGATSLLASGSTTATGSTLNSASVSESSSFDPSILNVDDEPGNDEAPPPYTLESSESSSPAPLQPLSSSASGNNPIQQQSALTGLLSTVPTANLSSRPSMSSLNSQSQSQSSVQAVPPLVSTEFSSTLPTINLPSMGSSNPDVHSQPPQGESSPGQPGSNSRYGQMINDVGSKTRSPSPHPVQDSTAFQGGFIGGFGQGQRQNVQSPRPVAEASSSLFDGFHQYQPAQYDIPHAAHSSTPPIPTHTPRPSLNFSRPLPQAQEWEAQDKPYQPDQGYPLPHSHYGGSPKPIPPPRHPSVAANHTSMPGGYQHSPGTPPLNSQFPKHQAGYPNLSSGPSQFPQQQSVHPHRPLDSYIPAQYSPPPHQTQAGYLQAAQPSPPPHQSQAGYVQTQQPSPPPIPPRPASASAAWGVVDKVAGKERRKKLEQGVDAVVKQNSDTVTHTMGVVVQSVDTAVQTGKKLLNLYKVPPRK